MLAMLPRLKTSPPHQISSYMTKKRISNIFVKGIFGYLLKAPLKVDTYNYIPTSVTGSFGFSGILVVSNFQKLLRVNVKRPNAKNIFFFMFHDY
jgi:hypothetical protein